MKRWISRSIVSLCAIASIASTSVTAGVAATAPTALTEPAGTVKRLALSWFLELQSGRIDRSKLDPTYSAQLSDDDVVKMSRYLKAYGPPHAVEVMKSSTIGHQTFYEYRIVLDRGDTLSMLIGFDRAGRITAMTFASMGRS